MNNRLANRLSTLEADQNRSGGNEALRERIERAKAREAALYSPAEQAEHEARNAEISARINSVREKCRQIGMRPTLAMLLGAARREA